MVDLDSLLDIHGESLQQIFCADESLTQMVFEKQAEAREMRGLEWTVVR